jgi:hypothetical protein
MASRMARRHNSGRRSLGVDPFSKSFSLYGEARGRPVRAVRVREAEGAAVTVKLVIRTTATGHPRQHGSGHGVEHF